MASKLLATLRDRSYNWLVAQTIMEQMICEGMRGRLDLAQRLSESASAQSAGSNFPFLQLRAAGLQASLDTSSGRMTASWFANEYGLEIFWEGAYPAERGFQFYSDLEFVAEDCGSWYLAKKLEQEAIHLLAQTSHVEAQAMAHFRLINSATMIGDLALAKEELQSSYALFDRLPSDAATRRFRADSEISLALMECKKGLGSAAMLRLEKVSYLIPSIQNFATRLRYMIAWSEVDEWKHDRIKEKADLVLASGIANDALNTLHSDQERWQWIQETDVLYRDLLDLILSQPHQPIAALATWESYRALDPVYLLPSENGLRDRTVHQLQQRVSHMRDSTAVVFSVLRSGVRAWTADDRGINEFALNIDPTLLQHQARTFYELCSDPHSSPAKVKEAGRRLYKVMVQPLASHLDSKRILFIEGDGFLSALPWTALSSPDGRYLGDSFMIASTPGLFRRQSVGSASLHPKTLFVAPGSVRFEGATYPNLAGAFEEITTISRWYPHYIELTGSNATKSAVLKLLPKVDIFHFAGHAITRDNGGELLVRAGKSGELISSRELENLHLLHGTLVVLSACSTAKAPQDFTRDPQGLVYAFLKAGASYVIASKWDVDSASTRNFMAHFYAGLNSGLHPYEALKNAQDYMQSTTRFSHPSLWSSFGIFAVPN